MLERYGEDYVLACRLEALFRLKAYDELITEISSISPSLQYDNEMALPALDRVVSLNLLLSEAKLMTGRSNDAFELLQDLASWLQHTAEHSINHKVRAEFWSWHVTCHVCNAHIRLRNWKSALGLLRSAVIKLEQSPTDFAENTDIWNVVGSKIVLLSRAAKLCLQVLLLFLLCFQKTSLWCSYGVVVTRSERFEPRSLTMTPRAACWPPIRP